MCLLATIPESSGAMDTLDTPDKETIGLMMDRHPVLISRKAGEYGVVLMKKPSGRKPKQKPEPTPDEQ